MQQQSPPLADWVLMSDLPSETNGLFTATSIDWLKRNRHSNGLAKHIKKVNGRLYTHLPSFISWFESHEA